MFDTAISSRPAFETLPPGTGVPSLQLFVLSNFADPQTKEREDLATLFRTGTVDNFIEFAEDNFIHIRKADIEANQGSSLQRHFVLNKDELLKAYDGDGRQDYVLLPQYGFVIKEEKDILTGENIFKNITFFKNDIVYSSSDILTSAKLKSYNTAENYADIIPASFNQQKKLYSLHIYK